MQCAHPSRDKPRRDPARNRGRRDRLRPSADQGGCTRPRRHQRARRAHQRHADSPESTWRPDDRHGKPRAVAPSDPNAARDSRARPRHSTHEPADAIPEITASAGRLCPVRRARGSTPITSGLPRMIAGTAAQEGTTVRLRSLPSHRVLRLHAQRTPARPRGRARTCRKVATHSTVEHPARDATDLGRRRSPGGCRTPRERLPPAW